MDDPWSVMTGHFERIKNIVEEKAPDFSSEEMSEISTIVKQICDTSSVKDFARRLESTFLECLSDKFLKTAGLENISLLSEIQAQWKMYKKFEVLLDNFFWSIEIHNDLKSLRKTFDFCITELYGGIINQVNDAVVALMGEELDVSILTNHLDLLSQFKWHETFATTFLNAFEQHIKLSSASLISEARTDIKNQDFAIKLIETFDKYLGIVDASFPQYNAFYKVLKSTLEVICREVTEGSSTGEFLATLCHNIIVGSLELTKEAIEALFAKVGRLVAYKDSSVYNIIDDIRCFEKAARLNLLKRSESCKFEMENDRYLLEWSILRKLGEYHPRVFMDENNRRRQTFNYKMKAMLIDLNPEKRVEFDVPYTDCTVEVRYLREEFWPKYGLADIVLPDEMVEHLALSEEDYEMFFPRLGRRKPTTWLHAMGSCTIKAYFERKAINLIVTVPQAAALVLFNNADQLSFLEIKGHLGLTDEATHKLLESLSFGKYKILKKKNPNITTTNIIFDSDVFEVNSKFSVRKRSLKLIPKEPILTLTQKADKKETADKEVSTCEIDLNRKIDAAIVRIMKAYKVSSHDDLILKCVEYLKESLGEKLMEEINTERITSRIETLIEREYMEIDLNDCKAYRYLP